MAKWSELLRPASDLRPFVAFMENSEMVVDVGGCLCSVRAYNSRAFGCRNVSGLMDFGARARNVLHESGSVQKDGDRPTGCCRGVPIKTALV